MKPYFEDAQAGIVIYNADCRDVISSLLYDAIATDPPYGIGADRNLRANKQHGRALAPSKDYGVGSWDASAPAPSTIALACSKATYQILWGGNYFSVVPSPCWLVWDKKNGDNGYADCELAWTNLPKAVRKFDWRWMGMLQEEMGAKEYREHPTQKPLALMRWCINQSPKAATVLDPFMGSGTTLRAAKDLGRKAIGIEINEDYCRIAVERLKQDVLPLTPVLTRPDGENRALF